MVSNLIFLGLFAVFAIVVVVLNLWSKSNSASSHDEGLDPLLHPGETAPNDAHIGVNIDGTPMFGLADVKGNAYGVTSSHDGFTPD